MFVMFAQGSGDTVHDILDPDPKLHALMPFAQYAKLQLLSPNSPSPSKVSLSLPFCISPSASVFSQFVRPWPSQPAVNGRAVQLERARVDVWLRTLHEHDNCEMQF